MNCAYNDQEQKTLSMLYTLFLVNYIFMIRLSMLIAKLLCFDINFVLGTHTRGLYSCRAFSGDLRTINTMRTCFHTSVRLLYIMVYFADAFGQKFILFSIHW